MPASRPSHPAVRTPRRERVVAGLTVDRIVDTALALVAEEGVAGLQMRALAVRLGVAPSALYRHVPSKDALLDALVERVLSRVDTNLPATSPWRDHLTELAVRLRATLQAHSGAAAVLQVGVPLGESSVRLLDVWARVLLDAGLAPADACQAWFALTQYVIGFEVAHAQDERDDRRARDLRDDLVARFAALDAARYPGATALGPHITGADLQARFDSGLDLLLDGLAGQVSPPSRSRRPRTARTR
jgi:TetR/AcrR family transcriptional regulator, tetracycline repressor protein